MLLPELLADIDPMEIYPSLPRPRPVTRPWLMINMISSADGASAINGVSGPLGNPSDQAVFSAVRACADWIVAAADTIRIERYRLPRPSQTARRARLAAGRCEQPGLAVVSSSLDLALDLPLFADQRPGDHKPLILTGQDAKPEAVQAMAGVAEVVRLASPQPQPAEILAALKNRGANVVLSEGGPSFNAQFADAALIDELCLSVAPLLAGGASTRMVHGSQQLLPLKLHIDHLLEEDDTLFVRYLCKGRRIAS